jgi:hypothetical protein
MYLPNELLELIFAYGFPWCITTGRLVDKEWKEKIDQMIVGMFITINQNSPSLSRTKIISDKNVWKSPIYDFHISKTLKTKILLTHIIIEINKVIHLNHKLTNIQCVNIYGYIFSACAQYGLTEIIYKQLPTLFNHSFSQENIHLRRFYRIIFGYMTNYTSYHKVKSVNDMIEDYLFFNATCIS